MPKERENSLCLGNNLAHAALVKRTAPATCKEAHLDVFSVLKDLSNKSDVLAEHVFSEDPHLDDMFAAVKETILLIRNCKTVKEIEYPPRRTFTMSNEKKAEEVSMPVNKTATPERHRETPIVINLLTPSEKFLTPTEMFVTPSAKLVPTAAKTVTPARVIVTSSTNKVTLAASSNQYSYPVIRLDKINVSEVNSSNKENYRRNDISTPQHLMQTPLLNKTFEKINKTLALDSKSASSSQNSNQKSKILNSCNNSVTKFENSRMLTRSGSKRKSSTDKNGTNKKQKTEPNDISVMSSKRTVQHPTALCEKNTTRAVVLASEKSKVSAVIVPSLQPKTSVISKEQQLLEELQKKEIKADQNRKKILAERQQKAEQSKKNREEKMSKTMQKRLQMEKLKEEKREAEAKKSQVKPSKENTKKTTRTKELIDQHSKENKSITTKELIDQHAKENKSMVLNAAKQSVVYAENIVKTPANRNTEVQSYDITPRADSSAYNFSEDEDEKPSGKPLPAWAQGGLLKSALLHQFYAPIDTDALFGSVIDTPNLAEIFKVNKKRYLKRTSSAVWSTPPNQCIR